MKKILIVGAGISGLYLANLLQKHGKYKYKILEKRSNLDLYDGYGIQISVNGIKLLNKIGFKEIAVHDIFYPRSINFYEAKNSKLISQIDISKYNEGYNYYTTLKRSLLLNFLLKDIPKENILFSSEIEDIESTDSIKVKIKGKLTEEVNYLAICDGVFSKSKNLVINKPKNVKFNNSVALRGNLKNLENENIAVYLGSNFHFVTYPINQSNEYNFISIIKCKNLDKIQKSEQGVIINQLFEKIKSTSSFDFENKFENMSLYPVFVSDSFDIPKNKNIFIAGDALFAFSQSFAQGASQSIESAFEIFENLEGLQNDYYKKRRARVNQIKLRSNFNNFAFQVSNPILAFARNIGLAYLTKNKKFLTNYVGKIYK